jgi:hypothetical protein
MSTLPFHPIVQQTPPSPDQAPAVTTLDRDVVVVAGAGAGKTRTLVARILHLLASGMHRAPHCRRHLYAQGRARDAQPAAPRDSPVSGRNRTALAAGERTPVAGGGRRPRRRAHRHDPRAVQRAAAQPSRRGRHRSPLSACWTRRPCRNCACEDAVAEALAWAAEDEQATVELSPTSLRRWPWQALLDHAAGQRPGCRRRRCLQLKAAGRTWPQTAE